MLIKLILFVCVKAVDSDKKLIHRATSYTENACYIILAKQSWIYVPNELSVEVATFNV